MKPTGSSLARDFLATPALWHGTQFGLTQFEFLSIDLNQFEPSHIPGKLRLGHSMEQVFLQLLQQSKKYEIVVHNLPIRKDGITLGEIDFIVRELSSGQLIHIELTYKFYLMDTSIPDPVLQWIGPNRKDRLIDKLEKVKNKQFKLLHSTKAIKMLVNNRLNNLNISQETCFKAQLFVPYPTGNTDTNPFNPTCVKGYWIRFEELKKKAFLSDQFYLPTKLEWPIRPHDNVSWISRSEVLTQISNSLEREYSPMVWVKKSVTEFEKFFVVWWG